MFLLETITPFPYYINWFCEVISKHAYIVSWGNHFFILTLD